VTGLRPDVSVVLLTKNGGADLGDLLRRLADQRTSRRVEIVAFDSGSTDGSVDLLRAHGARVTEIPPSEFNHGETRNQAIAASRSPLVVMLTQDAVPAADGWLDALLAPFEDPEVAGAYGRQIPRPDADVLTRRNLERWETGSSERRLQGMSDRGSYLRLHPMDRYKLCLFDDVCSALRRSAWERIPYERTYFAEDVDWGKKVIEAGWSIVYEPRAAVVHSHDRSVWYEFKRTYVCHRRLYELFGLRTVPRLREALRNTVRGSLSDAAYVWGHEARWGRRLGLLARTPLLALLSNLAQWRGAADERANRPLPAFSGV
jgi:GT2 family glycosyltransferase